MREKLLPVATKILRAAVSTVLLGTTLASEITLPLVQPAETVIVGTMLEDKRRKREKNDRLPSTLAFRGAPYSRIIFQPKERMSSAGLELRRAAFLTYLNQRRGR